MSHFISYQFLLSRCYNCYQLFWPLAKSLRNFQTYVLFEKLSCCSRIMDCYCHLTEWCCTISFLLLLSANITTVTPYCNGYETRKFTITSVLTASFSQDLTLNRIVSMPVLLKEIFGRPKVG